MNATASSLDRLCVDTIRTLSMDAVQQADLDIQARRWRWRPSSTRSGSDHLSFDPDDPIWPNRDRFVLSPGHASMLLYSMLHLTGVKAVNPKYETLGELSVTLDDIKHFRQLDSRCPGHPEYRWTSGVETTTGPLGQGVATSVGMAIASNGWRARSTGPGSTCSTTTCTRSRRRLPDGRDLERSGVARRPSEAREPLLDLRQQPHHDRGHRRRWPSAKTSRRASSRYGWNVTRVGDANDLEMLDRAFDTFEKTDRSAHADHRRQPHRLRRADQAGHARCARRAARAKRKSGRPSGSTAGPRTRSSSCPTASASTLPQGIGARGAMLRADWRARFDATSRPIHAKRRPSTGCSAGSCPTRGTRSSRHFPPTPKVLRGAMRRHRC